MAVCFPTPILDQELGTLPNSGSKHVFTCLYGWPSASLLSGGETHPVVALSPSWACMI